jgi:hypothetical protein
MKKLIYILFVFVSTVGLTSCDSWLEEQNYGNPTVQDMVQNEANIALLVGQSYADIKWVHDHWGYWGVSSLTSDECIVPVRMPGEHWSDGGYWKNLNTHKWNSFADAFKNIWNTTISGAVLCNSVLATMKENKAVMSENVYNKYVAELEVLRSYYYYMLFDCFGRIPYTEEFKEESKPLMEPHVVWSHLVSSLERNAPNLPIVNDANRALNYGRVTQGMAYSLLARLYLNAPSFGCTPQNVSVEGITFNNETDFYTKAIESCDKIIVAGSYKIEENFFDNFKIQNETSRENIFVIVENGNSEFDSRNNGSMSNKLRLTMLTLHYSQQSTWNMITKPWNGFCARPKFIERYEPTDVRGPGNEGLGTKNTKQWGWFVGPIYDAAGSNILKDENQDDAIIRTEVESLDAAKWGDGARMFKYEIDKSQKFAYCENDFVLFRYADVLYMKEEAILRGGTGVSGINTPDFQRIRTRAFAYDNDLGLSKVYTPTTLTLDELLNERGREFAWENVRRRDLLRYQKFSDSNYVQYIEGTEDFRKWFPIPYSVIEKSVRDEQGNPIWTQNPGYN